MRLHILAVGRPDKDEDYALEHAAARARERHAVLTFVGVWKPALLLPWAFLTGANPTDLIQRHAEESSLWVRDVVAGLPPDVSVSFACRQGIARRHIAAELCSRRYDELVVSRTLLGERSLSKLERAYPDLRIELVGRASRTPEPAALT